MKEELEKMVNNAVVNKLIPFSNVDGPGNRFAIFFQECNINCVYCHNHETINKCINCMECIKDCPTKAITEVGGKIVFQEKLCIECDQCIRTCKYSSSPRTKEYSVEELLRAIEEFRLFVRGITVSGGEPTLQHEFISELFKKVKAIGLTCFVDTNGFFDKTLIEDLISETDKFMVDIKATDNLLQVCESKMNNNLDNLRYLLSIDKVHEVRCVIILDYMDIENTIDQVSAILKDYPEVIFKIIRVHSGGLSDNQKEKIKDKSPSAEYIMELAARAERLGVKRVETII